MAEYLSPGIYVEEFDSDVKTMNGVSTSTACFVGFAEKGPVEGVPVHITSMGDFQRNFGGALSKAEYGEHIYLYYAVEAFFYNGGSSCYVMRAEFPESTTDGDIIESLLGSASSDLPGKRRGLKAFLELNDVSIMTIPGYSSPQIHSALIAHCENCENRFGILDAACDDMTVDKLAQYKELYDTTYAAIYAPWIQVYSAKEKTNIFIPPSGAVAGIYARTDNTRGVWKSPANEVVRNCTALMVNFNETEQSKLNPKGINLIRPIQGSGLRVWGARTLSSDGNWKYINIRRLFIYIEESIKVNINWAVFEPNDATLWSRVKGTIELFLNTLWRDGALLGSSPGEAFYVNVGLGTTMTQDDIANRRLICEIGVAPVRPAEYVIFRITQYMQN